MAKSNKGVSGVSREAVARRDLDREVWRARQSDRRAQRDQRSGVFGYGMLAGHRKGDESDGTDRD